MAVTKILQSIFFLLGFTIVSASDTKNVNVREYHTEAFYVNIPVDAVALQAVLPAGLHPNIFNGTAWISVDVDTFAKLEKVVLGVYVNTFPTVGLDGSGFFKVTLLVTSALYGPGYFIHELDFDNRLLTTGCKATQTFTCSYSGILTPHLWGHSIDVQRWESPFSTSGPKVHVAFTKGGTPNKPFVSFVLGRKIKYQSLTGGKLIAVNQYPSSSPSSYSQDVQSLQLKGVPDLGLLKLGDRLPKMVSGWSVCDAGTCFLQPSYTLIDHIHGNDVPSVSTSQSQLIV